MALYSDPLASHILLKSCLVLEVFDCPKSVIKYYYVHSRNLKHAAKTYVLSLLSTCQIWPQPSPRPMHPLNVSMMSLYM